MEQLPANAWNGEENIEQTDDYYIAAYQTFQEMDTIHRYIPNYAVELSRVQQFLSNKQNSDDEKPQIIEDQKE